MPSILDRIEQAYDHALRIIETFVDHVVDALARYSERIYRFLRHLFLQTLKLIWILLSILVYSLAPAFTASFGDELVRLGPGGQWPVFIGGLVLLAIGGAGLIGLVLGLIDYCVKRPKSAASESTSAGSTKKPRRARFTLVLIDLAAIGIVYLTYAFFSLVMSSNRHSLLGRRAS